MKAKVNVQEQLELLNAKERKEEANNLREQLRQQSAYRDLEQANKEWRDAVYCEHCEGSGVDRVKREQKRAELAEVTTRITTLYGQIRDIESEQERQADPAESKWPSWDKLIKPEKLNRAYEFHMITKQEKEMASGSVGIFNAKVAAHVLNNDAGLWAGVKKALGRSFVAVVDEEHGNIVLKIADTIHDGPCWYTHDVAFLTREDDETVERWCQSKFIAGQVRRGEEPIPFGKQGKTTTFNRDEVIAWWARKQAPVNPQVAAVAAARNGKRKR